MALGLAGSIGIDHWTGWRIALRPEAVLRAVGFAAAAGIFFGFYPARKAASL